MKKKKKKTNYREYELEDDEDREVYLDICDYEPPQALPENKKKRRKFYESNWNRSSN